MKMLGNEFIEPTIHTAQFPARGPKKGGMGSRSGTYRPRPIGAVTPARGAVRADRGPRAIEGDRGRSRPEDREKSASIGHFFTCYLLTFGPALSYLTDRRPGLARRRLEKD